MPFITHPVRSYEQSNWFLAHSSICPHPAPKLGSNSFPSPLRMSPTSNSLLPNRSMSPARDLMIGGFLLQDSEEKPQCDEVASRF